MTPTFWTTLSIINYIAVAAVILRILIRGREPRGMMAWILALLLLPVIGLILYGLIGHPPIQQKVRKRQRRRRMIANDLTQHSNAALSRHDVMDDAELEGPQRSLIRVATRLGGTVVTGGNDVEIYHDAEAVFLAISLAIEAAQEHVHMQYYIFANDQTGRAIRDLLVRKAREGVEVRLLLDAVGSWRLRRSFTRQMRREGVKAAYFLPWGLTERRFHVNCRNHRKLVVVDGRTGFTGSQNIGDEYLGRRRKYGPWRDTHLRLRGPSVAQLQEVFVEDWYFATRENLTEDRYFPIVGAAGPLRVQLVPSGPDRRPDVMHQLLFAAVSDAHHAVALSTPYFVPDRAMVLALKSAAYRGVRVRLLIPSDSDHRFVLWAARSYYAELIEAGVEIYEYDGGMLHSKVVVIDRRWAMVGSANMDERSFRLNFELTSVLYDVGPAQQLLADFDDLRVRSRRVLMGDIRSWNMRQDILAGAARLAAPLL
jgi:cardiolipin synthase